MEHTITVRDQALSLPFLDKKEAKGERLKAFLTGRNGNTLRTFQQGFKDYAEFICRSCQTRVSGEVAVELLLHQAPGTANAVAYAYRSDMIEEA